MDKFVIRGGKPLYGEVNISGMKNSALPIIFGTVAAGDICTIENIPDVSDIFLTFEILREIGAKVRLVTTDTAIIDTRDVCIKSPSVGLVDKMRASTYLLGAMLGRFGEGLVGLPGGCNFGERPVGQHIKGFESLGAKVELTEKGELQAKAENGLKGNAIYFDIASVGTTINVMLAAVYADGITVLENCAREPHIVDTASFLNACGADISGAGTSTIRIRGVKKLHGCTYRIAPDMIEAGTFMVAAAATRGRISVKNVIPKHMDSVSSKLREMGVTVEVEDDSTITVSSDGNYRSTIIKTNPYPGFPTDMQPQFAAMLCLSSGISTISEGIWSNRFKYVEELNKMGADIVIADGTAHITGVAELHGANVRGSDLRAGAALVIAALAAEGTSVVSGLEYIDRGYEDFAGKLKRLGADIKREQ